MERYIRLYHQLQSRQQSRFARFVQSPGFNTDQRLMQIQAILHSNPEIDRQSLHTEIFPDKPFDYSRVTVLFTYLIRLLETFLWWENQTDMPRMRQLATLQHLHLAGSQADFAHYAKRIANQIHTADSWDEAEAYFAYQYWGEIDRYSHRQAPRSAQQALPRKITSLETGYFVGMLKASCQWLNQQNVVQHTTESEEITAFIPLIRQQEHRYRNHALIQRYYRILMVLLEENSQEHYTALKSACLDAPDPLPDTERIPIFQYAQNYCVRQINQGHTHFLQELFDWYVRAIADDLALVDGFLPAALMKNVVSLGVRLGAFSWTQSFLQDYATKIPPHQREWVLAYNQAYLLQGQGALKAAMRLLVLVDFEDVYYYLGAKTLLLKIYFSLKDHDGLAALVPSFEAYIRRNKLISAYQRKVHLNLLRFTRKLDELRIRRVTFSPKAYRQKLALLNRQITDTQAITNISWLLDQLERTAAET